MRSTPAWAFVRVRSSSWMVGFSLSRRRMFKSSQLSAGPSWWREPRMEKSTSPRSENDEKEDRADRDDKDDSEESDARPDISGTVIAGIGGMAGICGMEGICGMAGISGIEGIWTWIAGIGGMAGIAGATIP